ncbi:MAG TPA: hypothetical protein PKD99_02300 [Sphingopyxis sp.]|nr:hypothetical protein [Sphingopyxis sp.]HMP43908.1 hypothetical protein [Sphingopyxis sp.]HMQ18075.1 hypothetical protein [Sphingopyxis sp.]
MTEQPIRLLIATHTHGYVTPAFAQSLATATAFLTLHGVAAQAMFFEDSLVDRGRDRAAAVVMENDDITHLLFIDADIEFRPQDVIRLLAADKDIVVGAYRKKNDRDEYAIAWLPDAGERLHQCEASGCIRIARAGTGFMLIARRVFERLAAAMPEIGYDDTSVRGEVRPMHAFFEHVRRGRKRFSEDYEFCQRWLDIEGEIWMDPGLTLGHWGPHPWRGSILDHLVEATAPEKSAA